MCDEVWNSPEINVQALKACKKLAESGDASAQFQYGAWLLRLPEEYANKSDGIAWIRQSAQNRNIYAQVLLAKSGTIVDFDKDLVSVVEAYAWYAVLNDDVAMKRLSETMKEEEILKAQQLAQEYVKKYRSK
jgi:hypothetical protein